MLTIRLFGPMEVRFGTGVLEQFPTYDSRALFAFLLLHRDRLHSRESLTNTFWSDQPERHGRKCLRMNLWRLHRILEPVGTRRGTYLVLTSDGLGFNAASKYWLDVEEFQRRLRAAKNPPGPDLTPAQVQLLKEAEDIYRGNLLEGMDEEWCFREREHYKALYRFVLEWLMRYHEDRGDWDAAVGYAQRLLNQHPLLESAHRSLMSYLYAAGDRAAAIRQYDACARLLDQNLTIAPMPETVALYEDIKAGRHFRRLVVRTDAPAFPAAKPADAASNRMQTALREVESNLEAAQFLLSCGIRELRQVKLLTVPSKTGAQGSGTIGARGETTR